MAEFPDASSPNRDSRITTEPKTQKARNDLPPASAIHPFEIARRFPYPPTMSNRSGGPKTDEGKAVTRYNAAKYGIYSVTPVLPKVERQKDWLDHHDRTFADLAPDGYVQEIMAERIAITTWRLRRLVRYEREQVRNRQRSIGGRIALNAMHDGRKLQPEPLDEDLDLIDRWAMDALIPLEKELMLLMRWEGRLVRDLRRDLLHLEHMQAKRREDRPSLRAALAAVEEPLPSDFSPLPRTGDLSAVEEGPGVRALRPVQPESLDDPFVLRLS